MGGRRYTEEQARRGVTEGTTSISGWGWGEAYREEGWWWMYSMNRVISRWTYDPRAVWGDVGWCGEGAGSEETVGVGSKG